MQGKILIVDAIATNRIVLKVKLASAFYEVLQAGTMADALEIARDRTPDLILSALCLPDGCAGKLSAALRAAPDTEVVPVIAIAAHPDNAARLSALQRGVQDVLHKPVDDTLLLGRVRSVIRAHNAAAEWQVRGDASRVLGLAEPEQAFEPKGHCILVGQDSALLQKWAARLRPTLRARLTLVSTAEATRHAAAQSEVDVFVLALPRDPAMALNQLRLIAELRAHASTRHAGVLVLQTQPDPALGAQALDLGADDLMSEGFDAAELALRFRALLRAKRMQAQLRASVRTGLQAAVFDPLTGLHNRRYAMPHLNEMAEHADNTGHSFAVLAADLDHFKRVNDLYGHASGDAVLVEVAARLRAALRSSDMVSRIGGEEFMVVMPATTLNEARRAAMRICDVVAARPIRVPGHPDPINVTISIGMAYADPANPASDNVPLTGESLLDRADKALYAAKGRGRNQVTLGRPAA
ncbi:diguanylate cyclase [uncultured Sulfitobacter sp.]|uniref:diguanylate cyclase n=1 Tax=uncultured Sulfitobacter sp. TaxID=191468 RepID=UPI0026377A01|nr:diguanylate cyclase [uncultured Sulfitobacter sp.]